jgi:hypothetical protein
MIRHAAIVVLLVFAPFQAALGAGGLPCAAAGRHAPQAASMPHHHDAAPAGGHVGDAVLPHDGGGTHDDSAPSADGVADRCDVCSACCLPAVAVTTHPPLHAPRIFGARAAAPTEARIASRPGDGPFRPPRTSA